MKKVIKSLVTVFALGVLPDVAASETFIPVKEYVDSGLRAVYKRAKDLDAELNNNLNNLNTYVGSPSNTEGAPTVSLTQQIEGINNNLSGIEGRLAYTSDNLGISIENRTIGIQGLSSSSGADNRVYVFKNNTATELDIADTWSVAKPTPEGNGE